jgi:lipopolysaccharide export system protein LptA
LKRAVTLSSIFFLIFFTVVNKTTAQVVLPQQSADTVRVIQIIEGKSLREKLIDSVTSLQTIAGNVRLREGLTIFICDSAIINKRSNELEAFGNIHINQNDSIHAYSQYLKYIGQDRIAHLKKDVRLTDKKGTLYTQALDYDLKTNIGTYQNGGRVVNGKTTLTSEEGVYYADTKDVFFKKNVHLTDPKYNIWSDSLQYNTETQVVNFITQTHIRNKDGGDIYTSSGNYDLKNGKAFFGNRTLFIDSTRTYVGDVVAIDETSKTAQLQGNAVVKDSVDGYSIIGGEIFVNQNNKSFLATRKPVLIFKGEAKDSTFIAADTLYSGIETTDSTGLIKKFTTDTLKKTIVVNETGEPVADSAVIFNNKDSITEKILPDKILQDKILNPGKQRTDSLTKIITADSLPQPLPVAKTDTSNAYPNRDSTAVLERSADSSVITIADTTKKLMPDSTASNNKLLKDSLGKAPPDTIRYFQAFHNVRIFNDSLQAVCDSLYYTSRDSVFRLYKDPLVFSNKSQIAGDTINLFTKNRKAERIYVFENGIIINEVSKQMYNQAAGRTLNGYFLNGVIDFVRVKGSPAESVFYPQDDDSAFTGMNRCKGDVIELYFVDKAVNKVKVVNDVDGIFFPIRKIPEDQKQLAKFKWLDSRRPKNKFELFE